MTVRIGVLTVSDRASAGEMEDRGGPAIEDALAGTGWTVGLRAVIPDELTVISDTLRAWCDGSEVDVVLTTGGTGLGPRDVTPEATLAVAQRQVPGIAEAIRAASVSKTPMAMISRGQSVVRGQTLIVNLPGSPRGAAESTAVILPILEHAVAILHGGKH